MKTGRFARSKTLILNSVAIVVLLIVYSFIVTGCAQGVKEKDVTLESDLAELLNTVYCYCGCTRETIEVCTCGTAANIEDSFRNRLLTGETVEQIRTDYLDTYGPQYYAVMPVEGINLIAYTMPVVILALIGVIVFVVLLRSTKSRQRAVPEDANGESDPQVSDETVKQVEVELEKYKQES